MKESTLAMISENQHKNIQKHASVKPPAPSKNIVDIGVQTDGTQRSDESCQTDSPERKDFQVQANFSQQGKSITTQTDSSVKCDFQVQTNIARESNTIETQTIKEEIRTPNIPSSLAQIPAKKRKLSSVSPSSAESTNVALSVTASGDHLSNNQAVIEPSVDKSSATGIGNGNGDQSNNVEAVLDDAILNSEVYQIYCRNEDPKEALKQIRQLKRYGKLIEYQFFIHIGMCVKLM